MATLLTIPQQLGLWSPPASPSSNSSSNGYPALFKNLYYYLYTNSNTSRAERIISDLSNLLLCKAIAEHSSLEVQRQITSFLENGHTANELLMPILRRHYPRLVQETDQFTLDDGALRHALGELNTISLQNAPAHLLGEAFQALIGPRLRGDKGQFFTPKTLVRAMVAVINPRLGAKVVDPACGTGGFLLETYAHLSSQYLQESTKNQSILIGIDKDGDLARLSEAILEVVAPSQGHIFNQNALDIESLKTLSPEFSPFEADYVLTNPPFGSKIKVTDTAILRQYKLGHKWTNTESGWKIQVGIREAQDPQLLFIELCIKLLKPGGRLGIVLPEGVFGNSQLGYVWDYLRSEGQLLALIDCPRNTFQPSTDIKTNVLFFEKNAYSTVSPPLSTTSIVWTAVALHCGHDRRGRTIDGSGNLYPDDFLAIGETYANRETTSTNIWQATNLKDPYYLVPRYYDQTPFQELVQENGLEIGEIITLGEMVRRKYIKIRKGHEVGSDAYGTGEIAFIRTSDLANYEVSMDPTKSISAEVYEKYAKPQQLKANDILFVCDGRYRIGRTAILQPHNLPCVVQSHVRIISVVKNSPVTPFEVLYLLNLPSVQHQIRNLIFIQSTLGSIGKRLNEIALPFPKPTPEWQTKVEEFRQVIQQRAKLLEQLRTFEGTAYDL